MEKDRLSAVIQHLKENRSIFNDADFATSIGKARSYISEVKSGKRSLTEHFVLKICNAFPEISSSWLLTGEGSMLVENSPSELNQTPSEVEKTSSEEKTMQIPLIPISAQGGSLNDFVTSVDVTECEMIISPIKGADYAITVSGESMSPEYPSGSQVLIKKINERAFIDWGRVYVLDTCNGTVVKRLFPAETPGSVLCKSINPEYPPFEVSLEDVYGVYRVLMCMSMK